MSVFKSKKKLETWQERYAAARIAYEATLSKMDEYEALYRGTHTIKSKGGSNSPKEALHVRNIVAEIIEAQIDTNIPQPKVTAQHKGDEHLAKIIEDVLRCEISRIPFEVLNDEQERTCPIQGGSLFLTEWDNTKRTHTTVGELRVSVVHPKAFIPQDGIYKIEDMDYCFLILPQTKKFIERKYKIKLDNDGEEEPDVRGVLEVNAADDLVTQIVAYYRNDKGGIGLYSWVNSTELDDIEDYQARKTSRCAKCDAPGYGECKYCGSKKFNKTDDEYRELYEDVELTNGEVIPALELVTHPESGELVERYTRIPYYKPDIYPVSLRKNVSIYGQFLGDSDVAKIADQQNSIKKLSTAMIEKTMLGGSVVTLPKGLNIQTDDQQMKVVYVKDFAEANQIGVHTIEADISQTQFLEEKFYQEARQATGITDSFQGRKDNTAVSAKAKEFAASQSAGRLESKRVMKNACYQYLFESMFKYLLAYTDEPMPIVGRDAKGEKEYTYFNPYDFLKKDAAGQWYWNTDFIFDCDSAAPLANNREALWQETRQNYSAGTLGDPSDPATRIYYWRQMEKLHYPGAAENRAYLESKLAEENQQQMLMQQAQVQMQPQIPLGGDMIEMPKL